MLALRNGPIFSQLNCLSVGVGKKVIARQRMRALSLLIPTRLFSIFQFTTTQRLLISRFVRHRVIKDVPDIHHRLKVA